MKNIFFYSVYLIIFTGFIYSQDRLEKTLNDTTRYTNVGNIGLTVTNFGTYGHGFALWPNQPSCEYPIGSGIEHIFDGGLWIGGYLKDTKTSNPVGPFVTTGAVDAASVAARGGGFEYTNTKGSTIIEKSSLIDSRYYNPSAISHQDFIMDYSDTSTKLLSGETIEGHNPLGVAIHHESYAWNFPFADFFVIMNYTIKNVSQKYLDSVFVGLWTDAVVRNTKITPPRGSAFFNKGGDGYSDSMKIAYEFDAAGDVGFTDSYVGFQFLGSTPSLPEKYIKGIDTLPSVNFVSWQFQNNNDPNFFAPTTDHDRYIKMNGYFDVGGNNRYGKGISPSLLQTASNRSLLITSGAYRDIAPGDSINVVFAIVCAKKFGTDNPALDTREQRTNLYNNAEWALKAYFGEDRNRNGILDPGEDLDGNGKITRYILPAPPYPPIVKVIPSSKKAIIYWDDRAVNSVDPISGKKDFEGFKLYRTQAGFDISNNSSTTNSSLVLMAQFDSSGNDVGFNTGFGFIKLDQPMTFKNDTTKYWFKYEVDNLLNGWQYLFSVTSFDKGDPANNLESLESSSITNMQRIIPGTTPVEEDNVEIGVYPNPYYGNAIWDGNSERLRKIYFYNLPADCEITIYTLSGDVVKRIQHNSSSNGSDLKWFENYAKDGKQQFAGGEHAWDLITDQDQAIATGLYLFTVKNNKNGNIKTGKFLIIK